MQSSIIVPYFLIFLSMWAYLRHYINLCLIASFLPLPSPFPSFVNDNVRDIFYTASNSTSDILSTITPKLAPLAPYASFPGGMAFLTAAQSKAVDFLQGESTYSTVGPYTLNWDTQQYKCWIAQWITFGLLAALQLVNMYWFYLIMKILWRLATSSQLDDVRSEDGDDDEDEVVKQEELEEMKTEQGDIKE
jgi:hypothetical protein